MVGVSAGRSDAAVGWIGHILAIREWFRLATIDAVSPIPRIRSAVQCRHAFGPKELLAAISHSLARSGLAPDLDGTAGKDRTRMAPTPSSSANVPTPSGFSLYEGVVATDRWFGPLFTNLRLTRTHAPVRLRADFPLLHIQPVQEIAYSDEILSSMKLLSDIHGMQENDWANYRATIVAPNEEPNRAFGEHAVAARKQRKTVCPAHKRGLRCRGKATQELAGDIALCVRRGK